MSLALSVAVINLLRRYAILVVIYTASLKLCTYKYTLHISNNVPPLDLPWELWVRDSGAEQAIQVSYLSTTKIGSYLNWLLSVRASSLLSQLL